MNKIDLKISLLLGIICFVSGFFVLPYYLENLPTQELSEFIDSMSFSLNILTIMTSVQLFIFASVLSFVGLKIARRTGFTFNILYSIFDKSKVVLDKKAIWISIMAGVIIGFALVVPDKLYYQYQIPIIGESEPQFSLLGLIAGVLYGGVFEEILLRLFFMSLLVWIFMKIFKANKDTISNRYFWIAIFISSLIFAAGHLPATQMFFGELTTILIVRSFLLNGIGGVVFGYLYWKKGFEYAILAHMFAHISMQLIYIPIFY